MILWDVIMCEGLPVILRIAVSILQAFTQSDSGHKSAQVLKDSLLSMEFEDTEHGSIG